MIKLSIVDFLNQNWILILILAALLIMLRSTVYFAKRTIVYMYVIIVLTALLSVVQFFEMGLSNGDHYSYWRAILTSVKYIIPSVILSFVACIDAPHINMAFFAMPAALNATLSIISIFSGIVFVIEPDNTFHRGPLGYLPFITCFIYLFLFVLFAVRKGRKTLFDILPIAFLVVSTSLNILLPILIGEEFEKWFSATIAIGICIYYIFLVQQYLIRDSLTGLLNRQSCYYDLKRNRKNVSSVIALDINRLKQINDTHGHAAGDMAMVTMAKCCSKAVTAQQVAYRVGGDEFVIICRNTTEEETLNLIDSIRSLMAETEYSCSIGYCYREKGVSVDEAFRIADKRMYVEKEDFYRSMCGPELSDYRR